MYPERELGIPSRAGPVSFAGFSPSIASSTLRSSATTLNGRGGGQDESLLSQATTVNGNVGSRRRGGRGSSSKGTLMSSLLKLF